MASGLEFRVDQLPVYADFEAASIGGNKIHAFDFRFKIFQQITHQANCPVSIMSNRTINDLNFHHKVISFS